MSAWDSFDEILDAAKARASRETAQINMRINEVAGCAHRKHKGFYNIKCEHPDRRPGEQCANLKCPVLFKE